ISFYQNLTPGTSDWVQRFTILPGGNVGIGTSAPTQKLEVAGTVKATAFQGNGAGLTGVNANNAIFANTADIANQSVRLTTARTIGGVPFDGSANINLSEAVAGGPSGLMSGTDKSKVDAFSVAGGNVGIGTPASAQKLEVAGTVAASQMLSISG